MNRLRWLWFAPVAFFALRVMGGQLVEEAIDQRDAPETFASTLLDNAEVFSIGAYLAGLSGLAFLWFAWALREKLRQQDTPGVAEAVAFGSAMVWGTLTVAAALLAATAPVLADYFNDPEGARLVTNVEFAVAPYRSRCSAPLPWATASPSDARRWSRRGCHSSKRRQHLSRHLFAV